MRDSMGEQLIKWCMTEDCQICFTRGGRIEFIYFADNILQMMP